MPHKKPTKKPSVPENARRLKTPDYRSFRLHKRIKHPAPGLPSSWSLFKSSLAHVWQYKKLYSGIALIYLLLVIVLVRGFIFTSDLGLAKETISELFSGIGGQIAGSFTVLGLLVETSSPTGITGSVYQSMILVLISLVMIWALRQTQAGKEITVKDAFYKSGYPLVPFLLVLFVIGVQMLPLIVGNFLYGATITAGIAITVMEKVLWGLLVFLLVLLSIYMVSASVFALYIVTLPDMLPMQALKSARNLVQYRRWTIMRKVLFMPFITLVIGIVIMLPVILILTPIAEIVFLLLSAALVVLSHSYFYSLYRELLNE
jgi:hypothetical protein